MDPMHEYEQARQHLLTSGALESFVEGRAAERLQAQAELGVAKNQSVSNRIPPRTVTNSLEPSFALFSAASAAAVDKKGCNEAKTIMATYLQTKERASAESQVALTFV